MDKKLSDNEIVKALDNDCLCVVYGVDCESCPLREKDCKILPEAIKDLIRRLQSENVKQKAEIERLTLAVEGLKGENKVIHKENDELLGKIERLTKENSNVISMNDALYREKAELQKQVDKAWFEVGKMCMEERKDTAKEILNDIITGFVFGWEADNEDYRNGYEQALTDYDEKIKSYIKEKYGVEVE